MSDARPRAPRHHGGMTRNPDPNRRATPDERRFLDALLFWKGLYAERGPRDREPGESLAIVIGEAERRMRALRLGALA